MKSRNSNQRIEKKINFTFHVHGSNFDKEQEQYVSNLFAYFPHKLQPSFVNKQEQK